MRRTRKILIPDVPPKRRSARLQNLRNWLRLSLRQKPLVIVEKSPVAASAAAQHPIQTKALTTDR